MHGGWRSVQLAAQQWQGGEHHKVQVAYFKTYSLVSNKDRGLMGCVGFILLMRCPCQWGFSSIACQKCERALVVLPCIST
eukprot:206807-Amphidinium_carterae.1